MLCVLFGASTTLAQDIVDLSIDLPILEGVELLETVTDTPQTEQAQSRLAAITGAASYEEHSLVRVNRDLAQVRSLSLPFDPVSGSLLDGLLNPLALTAYVKRTYAADNDWGFSWGGNILESANSERVLGDVFLFFGNSGDVSGSIQVEGQSYRIRSVDGDIVALVSLDETELMTTAGDPVVVPENGKGMSPDLLANPPGSEPLSEKNDSASKSDPPTTYYHRLLVLYTDRVAQFDTQAEVEQYVMEAVGLTNMAYDESNATEIQLQVVDIERLTGFSEYQTAPSRELSARDDLEDFSADPTARALRDQHQADLVMLVTVGNYGDVGGIAQLTSDFVVGTGTIRKGEYSIVQRFSLIGDEEDQLILAHEVGHNQGAHHHREDESPITGQTPTNFLYDYGYGWRFDDSDYIFGINTRDTYYSTVMAYTPCGADDGTPPCDEPHIRIPRFSNPDVTFDSKPTGVDNREDNARVLENTGPLVASFYANPYSAQVSISSPSQPNAGYYTYTATTGGEEAPSWYEWRIGSSPGNYGSVQSHNASFSKLTAAGTWYVKLRTGSVAGDIRTVYRTLVVESSGGGGGGCAGSNSGTTTAASKAPTGPDCLRGSSTSAPTTVELGVSPNPVRTDGQISVSLDAPTSGTLTLYDVLGREVDRLHTGELSEGTSRFALPTNGLPAGVYVLRLETENRAFTHRLTVAR